MPRPIDISQFRIEPGSKFRLKDHDPAWSGLFKNKELEGEQLKEKASEFVHDRLTNLTEAQQLLYAGDSYALLVILQAMDAAGKDGLIKHVMSGLNPQGCQVYSFKKPSDEELDHDFLWRCAKALPERGRIGIFNRSYYEEVLVVKVHPELLEKQKLPPGKRGGKFWEDRYDDINNFEKHLVRNGTIIVKMFLNVSKKEQKKRFLERLSDPEKYWKFSAADAKERDFWDQYQAAYQDAIRSTSTEWAPWYVIPADHKWAARAVASEILAETIRSLDLAYPKPSPEQLKELAKMRKQLEQE